MTIPFIRIPKEIGYGSGKKLHFMMPANIMCIYMIAMIICLHQVLSELNLDKIKDLIFK